MDGEWLLAQLEARIGGIAGSMAKMSNEEMREKTPSAAKAPVTDTAQPQVLVTFADSAKS